MVAEAGHTEVTHTASTRRYSPGREAHAFTHWARLTWLGLPDWARAGYRPARSGAAG